MNPNQLPTDEPIIKNVKMDEVDNDSGEDSDAKPARRSGRRKIKIEYIEDKNRRHITFSKRKAGIMKKAYELSTLTGTQVLLLVVSETGLVYTFTTVKLQPIVTKPEGKNLIQACLNAPDTAQGDSNDSDSNYNPSSSVANQAELEEKTEPKVEPTIPQAPAAATNTSAPSSGYGNAATNNGPYQQPYGNVPSTNAPQMPALNATYPHPGYMNQGYQQQQQQPQQQQQSPQQQPQQQPYGQMPGSNFYGNQQQSQYMQHQQPQHPGYWSNNPTMRQQDDNARRGLSQNKK